MCDDRPKTYIALGLLGSALVAWATFGLLTEE
jgi:hypothetical protein